MFKNNFKFYLAGEYETKKNCDGELAVTEEYDVEKIGISRMLEEKPQMENMNFKILHFIHTEKLKLSFSN